MSNERASGFLALARTAVRIGFPSIGRVLMHRVLKDAGHYRRQHPVASASEQTRLGVSAPTTVVTMPGVSDVIEAAAELVAGNIRYFEARTEHFADCPDWLLNPYSKARIETPLQHWSSMRDFDTDFGDIKTVWEQSRFSWALTLAQATLSSGNPKYLETANDWIEDWLAKNPYNAGPNWMCGQETSIRLIHVLLADSLIRRHSSSASVLEEFVLRHCERIKSTRSYAIAQKNNHIISEGAALFIGGDWLDRFGSQHKDRGGKFRRLGRRLLERQARKLILADGTFSQFSTNYHRLLLDTLSIAESWRAESGRPEFSGAFYERAKAATDWLSQMMDSSTGDVPNIGANDGAHIYQFCQLGYRDFRPTLQMAAAVFLNRKAISEDGPWDGPMAWLGIRKPDEPLQTDQVSCHSDGGFAVIRHREFDSFIVGRGARSRFRPSQADALHCDVWSNGINLLRDSGTYSYACAADELAYYKGTRSHNTVEFDDRDQMRTIGRFLFSDWIDCDVFDIVRQGERSVWSAAYTDYAGCRHQRTVEECAAGWKIVDRLDGPFERASLRWHLVPTLDWRLDSNTVACERASISVDADTDIELILGEGYESRHYLEQTTHPVLVATVTKAGCEIQTTVSVS